MDDPGLLAVFGAALGLVPPWQVVSVEFDELLGRLEIGLDFPRGSRFACPEPECANKSCSVHDTMEKRWRHLDFFEHQAFLLARVPRVDCALHGVHLVPVPWARPGSGFTLLMEVAMLTFAAQMPVAPLAKMARVHDTRIWRVLEHHVGAARAKLDFSGVTEVGVDETSARRGQDYVSIGDHLAEHLEGDEDAEVDLVAEGDVGALVPEASCDEVPALHRPEVVFDRYHVVAKINEAVDEVRRAESKRRPELKGSRYVWLKNETNLTARQRQTLTWLTRPSMRLATARAARWCDDFNGFYDKSDPDEAEASLKRWCYGAKRSRLDPVKSFVATIEVHWDGVVAWQHNRRSAAAEGVNSKIQTIKKMAYGYRNREHFKTAIFFHCGGLQLYPV